MRQVRKGWGRTGAAAVLEMKITADGAEQWVKLSCPLSAEGFCWEHCAWYAESAMGGMAGDPRWKMATCQGLLIGELVTEAVTLSPRVVPNVAAEERAQVVAFLRDLVEQEHGEMACETLQRALAKVERGDHWKKQGGDHG